MRILLDADDLRDHYRLIHVNTNNVGKGTIGCILSTIKSLFEYTVKSLRHRPSLVYLMVTRSKLGCIKDCVIMALAHLRGVPVVVHLRGGDLSVLYQDMDTFWKRIIRWVYGRVNLGIVLGESLRSQFDGLLPPPRVRVVLNCWLDGESSAPPCRLEHASGQPLRITFLSNVLPSKGLYDALEGAAWAVREGVPLVFRFAGEFLDHDGAIAKLPQLAQENVSARVLERRYQEMLNSLSLQKHVTRLGVVTGRDKWELLADTDILLLPIYNPTEGQPLVAIEAMRMGCAVISTCCGGLADIVEDGITGRTVAPRQPEEIGQAIKWFWEHPEELARIANLNIVRAPQRHSPEQHVRSVIAVFDEALSNKRGREKCWQAR